jgi:hypothetical protein
MKVIVLCSSLLFSIAHGMRMIEQENSTDFIVRNQNFNKTLIVTKKTIGDGTYSYEGKCDDNILPPQKAESLWNLLFNFYQQSNSQNQ